MTRKPRPWEVELRKDQAGERTSVRVSQSWRGIIQEETIWSNTFERGGDD